MDKENEEERGGGGDFQRRRHVLPLELYQVEMWQIHTAAKTVSPGEPKGSGYSKLCQRSWDCSRATSSLESAGTDPRPQRPLGGGFHLLHPTTHPSLLS